MGKMSLLFFKKINASFSAKVFTYLLGAMVFITGTFSFFYLKLQQENLEKKMFKDGRMLSGILASNARLGIFADNREQISASLKTAVNVEGTVGACVYSLEGQLLHRETSLGWEHTEICLKSQNDGADFLKQLKTSPEVLHLEDKKAIEFWRPVLARSYEFTEESLYFDVGGNEPDNKAHLIGFVGLVFDKGPIQQSIREILLKNILILTFFLFVGSIAAYFIIQAVTKPLNQLIANIKKTHGLKIESKDEVGLLADTFSNMVETLSGSFKTINELKIDLENKVEDLEGEINSRKKAEAALRESELKFRSISEGIADGVAMIQEGKFSWLNQSFCHIFGYNSYKELLGRKAEDLLQPVQQQSINKRWQDKISSESLGSPYQIEVFHKEGYRIILDVKPSKSIFEGKPAIELIIRNVTEKMNAEEKRKEMELKALSLSNLATIGEIATGIAHEINQPLTYIKIAYQAALRDLGEEQFEREQIRPKFREALRQVERITLITDHLRNFGRKNIAMISQLSVPKVFDNALILMAERIRLRNLDLIREIEEDLPEIYGNKMQLEQVFINLLQNSIDAMEKAGSGKIKVSMKKAGDFFEITFADTGPGIEPAVAEKIFEPFFTTKEAEKGVGLGLAISHNIIKEHSGTIEYRRIKDWGATFIISLPIAENR
jgi:PAS domain S-box-containing protein